MDLRRTDKMSVDQYHTRKSWTKGQQTRCPSTSIIRENHGLKDNRQEVHRPVSYEKIIDLRRTDKMSVDQYHKRKSWTKGQQTRGPSTSIIRENHGLKENRQEVRRPVS
ncbi:hypothetical protein BsWGS_07138 [Bradybaena similaris]